MIKRPIKTTKPFKLILNPIYLEETFFIEFSFFNDFRNVAWKTLHPTSTPWRNQLTGTLLITWPCTLYFTLSYTLTCTRSCALPCTHFLPNAHYCIKNYTLPWILFCYFLQSTLHPTVYPTLYSSLHPSFHLALTLTV